MRLATPCMAGALASEGKKRTAVGGGALTRPTEAAQQIPERKSMANPGSTAHLPANPRFSLASGMAARVGGGASLTRVGGVQPPLLAVVLANGDRPHRGMIARRLSTLGRMKGDVVPK